MLTLAIVSCDGAVRPVVPVPVAPPGPPGPGYYIGNSLTRDARPWDQHVLTGLGGGYDIRCGMTLPKIRDGQQGSCTVTAGGQWPVALAVPGTYEHIVVQPHWDGAAASRLSTDVEAIEHWAALQPDARVIIYQSMPRRSQLIAYMVDPRAPGADPATAQNHAYWSRLRVALHATLGDRLRVAPVADVIWLMMARGVVSVDDVYTDGTHHTPISAAAAMLTLASVAAGELVEPGPVVDVTADEVDAIMTIIAEVLGW